MVEVFKTNVTDQRCADILVDQIHTCFVDYSANFDLQDCDRILRVKSTNGLIESSSVINILKDWGYHAEVLPDEIILLAV
ncbi:MAG: hypothetical protein WKF97_13450 [Chitinophagaceae bacterium]